MLISLIERLLAFTLLIIFFPLFLILYLLVRLTSSGPFLFKQKRAGKDKKPFIIYKIRTMTVNAEKLKNKVKNEAEGPVFKNFNDPRFTKIGRTISRLGLDELPQLVNIVKGEMSFVGPRPLPLDEAEKISQEYQKRFAVKPGIFSSWVAAGCFHNDFKKWMMLDIKDINNKSFFYDLKVCLKSLIFALKLFKNFFMLKF